MPATSWVAYVFGGALPFYSALETSVLSFHKPTIKSPFTHAPLPPAAVWLPSTAQTQNGSFKANRVLLSSSFCSLLGRAGTWEQSFLPGTVSSGSFSSLRYFLASSFS